MTTRLLSRLAAPAIVLALAGLSFAAPWPAAAQRAVRPTAPRTALAPVDPALYSGLTWRNVGPFRGGRVAAVSGAVGQAGVFYIGLPAGGVWKTTSAGETWFPVFDAVKTVSSVGAVEVAPSDPNVVYAGTGDMVTGGAINEGDGVYRSADAGRTWQRIGLEATKQIPSILVDPRDPNLVLVAGQGNLHARSTDRGVFRSTDGGRTWTKTLYLDDETGIQKLARAYDVPDVIFATTDRHYYAPGAPPFYRAVPSDTGRTGTSLWKSTDNGVTWKELTGGGLPRLSGRTSVAVAMHTNAQRVFLVTNTGLYRSDDGGASWRRMDPEDERIRNGQGGYNCGVYVDPQNPDVVYTFNTAAYVSRDGGNTFTGFKGAPGGDDPQQMWIDPTNGQRILMGYDQGAIVSLDGGGNWSSWYNQSTEQVYHISTDASFPYWIYATQQDAGAVATRSRGNLGEITPLDWKPVPGWEWGSIVADPLHPDTVYASGSGIVKISYPDEQWINVSPAQDPSLKLRTSQSQPLAWAPWNQHELLTGFQFLMATTDGGVHWRQLSPDLTVVPAAAVSAAGGSAAASPMPAPAPSGAIESISPSTVAPGTIWVGTTTGRVQVTRDSGRTWSDVSIPGLPDAARALVESVEASHQDAAEAYAAVDLARLGDYTPYLFRTRDYGRTWTKITTGLPESAPAGAFARVIRSDTRRAGLLFAGTESSVWVSFDDGDHWQSLALNLPTTSYRDMTVRGNDLVVGTYGRGIWILDDISSLRQATPALAAQPAYLFKPGDAVRLRRNVNADTPFPPEVPHALNPPDGVIVDYWLAKAPGGEISLDVLDAAGKPVRHYSSAPVLPVEEASHPPEPNFWLATPHALPTAAGLNRVAWDLRYDAPPAFSHTFEINANPGLTPPSPEGPLALPGSYTLRLTVDGRTYTQTATVRPDPRSRATPAQLAAQHALLMKLDAGLQAAWQDHQQATTLRSAIAQAASHAGADVAGAAASLQSAIDSVAGNPRGPGRFGFRGGAEPPPTFVAVSSALVEQLNAQDNGDLAPTPAALARWTKSCRDLHDAAQRWQALRTSRLAAFNELLAHAGLARIPAPAAQVEAPVCQ